MKKRNSNILMLSLASVLGLVGAGCALTKEAPKDEKPAQSVIQDEVETADDIGTKVVLRSGEAIAEGQVQMASAFGYQVLNETEKTLSVRVIAVLNGYKSLSSASVTSKVVTPRDEKNTAKEDETIVKEEQTFDVKEVYSSLKDEANIKWTGDIDATVFAKKYYIVYTLRNVPVDHAFDTISVTFSATSQEETHQSFLFNAYGVRGQRTDLAFVKIGEEGNEYYVEKGEGTLSGVITIPEKYYEVTDYYATIKGEVTSIGDPKGVYTSSGAFNSCGSVTEYVLPSSIKTINAYAFGSNDKLKKINIPENVVSIGQSAFYGYRSGGGSSVELDNLVYSAKNLVNSNTLYLQAKNVVVNTTVESLPETFFASGYTVASLTYKGTEEQWNALKTDDNKGNGFFAIDAICADTTYSSVTFHYGEGAIGEVTGDQVVNARNRKTLANPGSPVLAGKEFQGWFLDEAGTEAYDFSTLVTAPFDLYAVYGEPSAGYSMDNPLVITPEQAENFTAELYPGKEYEYIKLSIPSDAPKADWYYLSVDESNCVRDQAASTASYLGGEMTVYDASKNEIKGLTTASVSNTMKAQCMSYSYTNSIRLYGEPGTSYYIKARMSSTADKHNYGTIAFKFKTYDHDTLDEAEVMEFGNEIAIPEMVDTDHKVLLKYTATATKEVLFNRINMSTAAYGTPYMNLKVVDGEDVTKELLKPSGTSNTNSCLSVVEGHTYYIEAYSNYATSHFEADNWVKLSFTDTPAGYSFASALAYTIGETATVEPVNLTIGSYEGGAYYTFTVAKDGLYTLSTNEGSTSYKNKVVIYKEDKTTKVFEKTAYYNSSVITEDITLEAGTYYMSVGYSGASKSSYGYESGTKVTADKWGTLTFSLVEVQAGDKFKCPLAITPALDTDVELTSTVSGRFYSIQSSADNYLIIDVSALPSGVNAEIVSEYSSLYVPVKGKITFKTVADTSYVLKLSGADGTGNVRFSRQDSVKNGSSKETALDFAGTDGIMDLTDYVTSQAQNSFWISYTASATNTYKLFFQSTLAGDGSKNGADTNIKSVVSSDGTALTAIENLGDDQFKHPETKGKWSAYAEYAFTAGETYFIEMKIPALSADQFDTLKFGIAEKQVGDSYDVASDLGMVDSAKDSLTAQSSANGYWNKITLAASETLTISSEALEAGAATISFYKEGDLATPVATISTGGDAVSFIAFKGTYYVCVKNNDEASASSVVVALQHKELPDYDKSNVGGINSTSDTVLGTGDIEEGKEWVDASADTGVTGSLKSGCTGTNNGRSILTYTFYKDGEFSFDWASSGEKNYDYLLVKKNDDDIVTKTDNPAPVDTVADLEWHNQKITVKAGDVVVISFRKDGSGNNGLDTAYLKNIAFTAAA